MLDLRLPPAHPLVLGPLVGASLLELGVQLVREGNHPPETNGLLPLDVRERPLERRSFLQLGGADLLELGFGQRAHARE
eukprot:6997479-Pyramimonas_sp.AAC.1